ADSRPFGYNPLTGTMAIGYNIYVGIVPGEDTKVDLFLRCNPQKQYHEFCNRRTADERRTPNILLPKIMRKNDEMLDQRYFWVDDPAKYWYNEVVLQLTSLGDVRSGQKKMKEYTWDIAHRGNLGYECHFDLISGITCQAPYASQSGILKIIPQQSKLSPLQPSYDFKPQNTAAALVTLDNHYQDKLGINYQGPAIGDKPGLSGSILYGIDPGEEDGQVYNLYALSFPEWLGERNTNFEPIEGDFRVVDTSGKYATVDNGVARAKMTFTITDTEGRSYPFDRATTLTKWVYINQKGIYLHYPDEKDEKDPLPFLSTDEVSWIAFDKLTIGLNRDVASTSTIIISLWDKDGKSIQPSAKFIQHMEDTDWKGGPYQIKADVLSTFGGEAPILYDGKSQELTFPKINYRRKTTEDMQKKVSCQAGPVVDIVEPTLPPFGVDQARQNQQNEGGILVSKTAVPIAANIRDDCNDILAVKVTVEGKKTDYKKEYLILNTDKKAVDKLTTDEKNTFKDEQGDLPTITGVSFSSKNEADSAAIKDRLKDCTADPGKQIALRFLPKETYPDDQPYPRTPPVYAFTWVPDNRATDASANNEEFLITIEAWDGFFNPTRDNGNNKRWVKFPSDSSITPSMTGSFTGIADDATSGTVVRSCSSS
ncbi:MAG: hypothetical protein GXP63_04915, partial [DPANN group archaeon]|nr:hypothetical protein [DPANN group archaeon]